MIGNARVERQTVLDLRKEEDKEELWRLRHKHLVAELNGLSTKEELVKFVVQMLFSGEGATFRLFVWHLGSVVKYPNAVPIKPRRGAVKTVGSLQNGWVETMVDWDAVTSSASLHRKK